MALCTHYTDTGGGEVLLLFPVTANLPPHPWKRDQSLSAAVYVTYYPSLSITQSGNSSCSGPHSFLWGPSAGPLEENIHRTQKCQKNSRTRLVMFCFITPPPDASEPRSVRQPFLGCMEAYTSGWSLLLLPGGVCFALNSHSR